MKTFMALLATFLLMSCASKPPTSIQGNTCGYDNVKKVLETTPNTDDDELEEFCLATIDTKQKYAESLLSYFTNNQKYFEDFKAELCNDIDDECDLNEMFIRTQDKASGTIHDIKGADVKNTLESVTLAKELLLARFPEEYNPLVKCEYNNMAIVFRDTKDLGAVQKTNYLDRYFEYCARRPETWSIFTTSFFKILNDGDKFSGKHGRTLAEYETEKAKNRRFVCTSFKKVRHTYRNNDEFTPERYKNTDMPLPFKCLRL
jgi:hypothetical protein